MVDSFLYVCCVCFCLLSIKIDSTVANTPPFVPSPSVSNTNVQNVNFPTSFAHLTHVCTTNCGCWMVYEMTLQFVSPIGADSGQDFLSLLLFSAFSSKGLSGLKKNLHPAHLFLPHTHNTTLVMYCSRLSTNKMEIWWDHFSMLFVQPARLVSCEPNCFVFLFSQIKAYKNCYLKRLISSFVRCSLVRFWLEYYWKVKVLRYNIMLEVENVKSFNALLLWRLQRTLKKRHFLGMCI